MINRNAPRTTGPTALHAKAHALYRERRLRTRHFPVSMFAEPMWGMLLDLYIADGERRRITVKSVCISADVPATTALRQLRWLHEKGFVERLGHPRDARSTYVRLTAQAITAMENYLAAIREPQSEMP
jgi:DNA-binding MarR family transcriptional regulator